MWRSVSSLLLTVLFCGGCATFLAGNGEYIQLERTAQRQGFQKHYLDVPPFTLTAYYRSSAPSETLAVYIEGDGAAWPDRRQPPDDPTPRQPLSFYLACLDPAGQVLYLARPGQFERGGKPSADPSYWRGKRYGREVVRAVNEAIDRIKAGAGAKRVSLAGYSGGGAVAVLAAAGRSDVIALRTVAGNLSLETFCRIHKVSPFAGSVDPASVAGEVDKIPQRHFVGGRDTVVTPEVVRAFLGRQGGAPQGRLTVVREAEHARGWQERWRELLALPLER